MISLGGVDTSKGYKYSFFPAEKSSSLPTSSRELAEIFGASDDEEDMGFPFSLGVGKAFPDLSLPDGRVSEFFLNSINSLSVPPVSMDSRGLVEAPKEMVVPPTDGDEGVVESGKGEGGNDSTEGVKEDSTGDREEVSTADMDGGNDQEANADIKSAAAGTGSIERGVTTIKL